MSRPERPIFRLPNVRRIWKPAAVTGAGGTAIAVWFEEIAVFVQDILALIFLPLMAGAVYLLDHFFFKARMPKRADLETTHDKDHKGAK